MARTTRLRIMLLDLPVPGSYGLTADDVGR